MKFEIAKCVLNLFVVSMALGGGRIYAQPAPKVLREPVVAGEGAERAVVRSTRYTMNGVTVIYQEFQSSTEIVPREPEAEFDDGDSETGEKAPLKDSQVLIGENAFEQMTFGQGWNLDSAERQLLKDLDSVLQFYEQRFGLTSPQKRKLKLAGRGDIARFLDTVRCGKGDIEKQASGIASGDAFNQWIRILMAETNRLRKRWTAPFGTESLLARTLAVFATPEQSVELQMWLERLPRPARPVAGAANLRPQPRDPRVDDPKQLADVLAAWEQAAAKIERLDCKFVRFAYDNTFEVERRGTGSLAVDREGRGVYSPGIPGGERARRLAGVGFSVPLKICHNRYYSGAAAEGSSTNLPQIGNFSAKSGGNVC